MKFIHIADVHLGARPEVGSGLTLDREKELYESFYRVIQLCEEEQVDLLLIAGDLFHRQPLLRELKEVNFMFSKLTHTKVVMIAGNHDYISPRSNYLELNWCENMHILSSKEMDSIYFEELNTEVYGFSYTTRDIFEDKYSKIIAGVEERINILLAHGGDERNIPINYNHLATTGFDYIALGHIHKPEIFSQVMAYSGSLEPLDKNELGEHGYIEGDIDKNESSQAATRIRFVPFSKREYNKLSIDVTKESTNLSIQENIRDTILSTGSQHLYQVTLKGVRDPELLLETQTIYTLGNIVEVIDEVLPDYNFEVLYQENKDNIIGSYINKIRNSSDDAELCEKALYYGIQALLNTKER